jgi:osmoprotectant transport system substrate-binding protein
MRGKWNWRRVLLSGLALLVALSAAMTAEARSSRAATTTRAAAPTIIVGSKNFTEEYVLAQLYAQALKNAGLNATYKGSFGSTELAHVALTSGKITMYPEYTGTDLTVAFGVKSPPKSASAVYKMMKSKEAAKGYVVTNPTPFQDVDAIAVTKATAKKYGLKTVADLKKIPNVNIGAFPEFRTREQGLPGLQKTYGLTNLNFKPFATIPVYKGLDTGSILAADVFTTDWQLGSGKYVVLTDTKHLFGFQQVAMIIKKSAATSQVVATINKVSKLLTTDAMIALNKAAGQQQIDPAKVAATFLKANHL